jgi:hypothetical protein
MTEINGGNEFNLYWWDPQGNQHEELRFVDAKRAVERAASLSRGPAAQIGMVKRIIITDGGDYTTFEWKKDHGVTYPPERAGWR